MVKKSSARILLSVLALSSLCGTQIPLSAAAGPKPLTEASVRVRDVQLLENGALELQLVDSQGRGLSQVPVVVSFQNRRVAEGRTDADGIVRMENLRGGQHVVQAGSGVEVVRLWDTAIAPPSAVRRLAIVSNEQVVRGQGSGPPTTFMGSPMNQLLVTGTILSLVGVGYLLNENNNQDDAIRSLQQQQQQLNGNSIFSLGAPVSP